MRINTVGKRTRQEWWIMKGHEKQREKGKEPKKAGKDLGRFYYLNIK